MGGGGSSPFTGGMQGIGDAFLPGMGSSMAVTQGKQTELEKQLAAMAARSYEQGDPFRQSMLNIGQGLMEGTQNVQDLPGYQMQQDLARRQTGDSFGMAMDQILANVPQGATGARTRAIQDVGMAQAEQEAGLSQQIASQMLNNYIQSALGLSTAGLAPGLQGTSAAAGTFGNRWTAGLQGLQDTQSTTANFFSDMFGGGGMMGAKMG